MKRKQWERERDGGGRGDVGGGGGCKEGWRRRRSSTLCKNVSGRTPPDQTENRFFNSSQRLPKSVTVFPESKLEGWGVQLNDAARLCQCTQRYHHTRNSSSTRLHDAPARFRRRRTTKEQRRRTSVHTQVRLPQRGHTTNAASYASTLAGVLVRA